MCQSRSLKIQKEEKKQNWENRDSDFSGTWNSFKRGKEEEEEKKASSKRWGVFDAGRITGPNKL